MKVGDLVRSVPGNISGVIVDKLNKEMFVVKSSHTGQTFVMFRDDIVKVKEGWGSRNPAL